MTDDPIEVLAHSANTPDVTVIIVSFNTAQLIEPMFEALEGSRGMLKLQVIVVDNASRDNSVEIIRQKFPTVELIENKTNVGFGRANNQAIPRSFGRYLLLLNTDAFVSPDTLTKSVEFMETHSEVGILGVKLVGRDGTRQPSCRYFPTPWNLFVSSTGLKSVFSNTQLVDDMSWDHATVRECDWVPGCYYLIRRSVIRSVGLFDPRFFLYFEEVDHCRRAKEAGWKVVYFPFTKVVHLGGESAASESSLTESGKQISELQIESELLFFRKTFGLRGLVQAIILSAVADFLKALNGIVRPRSAAKVRNSLRHTRSVLKVLRMTRFATEASR